MTSSRKDALQAVVVLYMHIPKGFLTLLKVHTVIQNIKIYRRKKLKCQK